MIFKQEGWERLNTDADWEAYKSQIHRGVQAVFARDGRQMTGRLSFQAVPKAYPCIVTTQLDDHLQLVTCVLYQHEVMQMFPPADDRRSLYAQMFDPKLGVPHTGHSPLDPPKFSGSDFETVPLAPGQSGADELRRLRDSQQDDYNRTMRTSMSALTALLIRKGVINSDEYLDVYEEERRRLSLQIEARSDQGHTRPV